MKFGKLLAAGKSWAGGNGIGRYQMRDGLHLPKFISPKNPFKQEAVAEPSAPPMVAAAPATEFVAQPAIVSVAEPALKPAPEENAMTLGASARSVQEQAVLVMRKGMSLVMAATPKLKVAAAWSGEALKRAAMFCLDHNPFSAIGKPKLAGIPRFGQPVVQGELSLDRVKVVRNDLSHADLEVVGQK